MPLVRIADLNGDPTEVAKRVEQAQMLSTMYDEWILIDQDGKDRAPGIHASELFPCARQAVYSCLDTPRRPKVSKFWKQRFKVGHALHSMLQADFHKMATKSRALEWAAEFAATKGLFLRFEDEVACRPELQALAAHYKIYSSADGVFTFYEENPDENPQALPVLRVGLEIKTESPPEYEKLRGPKKDHVRQTHLYMAVLDLPLMWFFYTNKGNQNNTTSDHPYLIPFDSTVWAEVETQIQTVWGFVARGELPDRVETMKCEFCAWAYECKPRAVSMYNSSPIPLSKTSLRRPGA